MNKFVIEIEDTEEGMKEGGCFIGFKVREGIDPDIEPSKYTPGETVFVSLLGHLADAAGIKIEQFASYMKYAMEHKLEEENDETIS